MEYSLYSFLFQASLIVLILTVVWENIDKTRTQDTIFAMMSTLMWLVTLLSSYNIQIYDGYGAFTQYYDLSLVGLSWFFFILSILITMVRLFYGSFELMIGPASRST